MTANDAMGSGPQDSNDVRETILRLFEDGLEWADADTIARNFDVPQRHVESELRKLKAEGVVESDTDTFYRLAENRQ